ALVARAHALAAGQEAPSVQPAVVPAPAADAAPPAVSPPAPVAAAEPEAEVQPEPKPEPQWAATELISPPEHADALISGGDAALREIYARETSSHVLAVR